MKRTICAAILAALSILSYGRAEAQPHQVEWKQTLTLPRGQNMPQGVTADILGIEAGDSYAEAKAKLEKLLAEAPPPPPRQPRSEIDRIQMRDNDPGAPLKETKIQMAMTMQGLGQVIGTYVGHMRLRRELPGSGNQKISEFINVYLSSPASGNQVVGIERTLSYPTPADQPRISELVAQLKTKFRSEPQVFINDTIYIFQFNDGRPVVPPKPSLVPVCPTSLPGGGGEFDPARTKYNESGDCDVVMRAEVGRGISPDHASQIRFLLSDSERRQATAQADYTFLDSYIRDLQSRTRGAQPKL